MPQMGSYLIKIVAAALICGSISRLFQNNNFLVTVIKLLCGVFMIYCIGSLVPELKVREFVPELSDVVCEADVISAEGKQQARNALAERIIEQSQSYILEKARVMDAQLEVIVEVSEDNIPVPVSVRLTGKMSPYARQTLSGIITRDLGIAKEKQVWI